MPHRALLVPLLLLATVHLGTFLQAQDNPTGKLPVPDMAEQQEARKSLKEVFRAEYKSKKPDARIDLARTMLERSEQAENETTRYAMLAEAIDLAVIGNRLELAYEIAQAMAARYDVDVLAVKGGAIGRMNASTMSPAEAELLLSAFYDLASEAAAGENYLLAQKVLASAADAFRKPTLKPLRDQAVASSKQYAALNGAFETARDARETLKTDPENAAANLSWGRFLCFHKQDWTTGLPLLAKANDKVWGPLAQRDLAPPTEVNALLQLGDDWLKAGEKEKEPAKLATRLRADHHWNAAMNAAPQTLKADVDKKLDPRIVKLFGPSYASTTGDPSGAPIPGSEKFSPGENFTIEFWVSTKWTRGTLVSKKHSTGDASVLSGLNDGVPGLSFGRGGGEGGSDGRTMISDGRWHHIAIVKQGSDFSLFVDGNQECRGNDPMPLLSNSPWKLGCSHSRASCAAHFGGVRISSSARYTEAFKPQRIHAKDRTTLFP